MDISIKIARDFSRSPGARYYKDGKFSGEEFFDKLLGPKFRESLDSNSKLIVDLDGSDGYATSFLDEAFHRLGDKFSPTVVLEHLVLISNEEPDWIPEILQYINYENKRK